MLKRFLVSLTALSLASQMPLSAYASPETAEDWGLKASTLYAQTTELIANLNKNHPTELEATYTGGLAQFSVIAGRLAAWIDTSGGAADFGCIYRGMAEEAELQLEALQVASTKSDAKTALTRIATLLDDAQSIAIASAYAARNGNVSATQKNHCPASAASLDQYLTEHP